MPEPKQTGIAFDRVLLRRLQFQDLGRGAKTTPVRIDLTFKVDIAQDNSEALVAVTLVLRPEGTDDSRVFETTMEGRFRPLSEEDKSKLSDFVNRQGAALVMPFIREIIANVSARSESGPLLLPPLNVSGIASEEKASS